MHESRSGVANGGMAFLLGAVTGAVTALLLAPASGVETRRRLGERMRSAYRKGEELAEEVQGSLSSAAQTVRGRARKAAAGLQAAARGDDGEEGEEE